MTIRFRRAGLLAVLLAGVLALSGCAIGPAGSEDGKPTIRIAYQSFPSGDLVAKHHRWLEEALPGYTIRWTKFDSGADINTAFVAGELDVAAIGSSPVARGLSAPLNIPYQVAFVLDVAGDNEALVARHDTGITDVAGLRGKRIATAFASTSHYSLLAALARAGLSPSDVQLVDLQPQASLAAWERGDIDAAYTWLPTLDQLRATGKTLVTSRELAAGGKPTLDLGVVSRAFAEQHPDAVDAWRKVQARALDTVRNDPPAAARAIAAETGATPEEAANQLRQGVFLSPRELTSPGWLGTEGRPGNVAQNLHSAARFLAEQKQIPAAPELTTFQDAIYTKGLPDVLDAR